MTELRLEEEGSYGWGTPDYYRIILHELSGIVRLYVNHIPSSPGHIIQRTLTLSDGKTVIYTIKEKYPNWDVCCGNRANNSNVLDYLDNLTPLEIIKIKKKAETLELKTYYVKRKESKMKYDYHKSLAEAANEHIDYCNRKILKIKNRIAELIAAIESGEKL